MKTNEKLFFLVLCQLATMCFSLVLSIPIQNPDGNFINMNYLGSVEGKSFFAEMTPLRNWTEAKRYCEQSGMNLTSIDSAAQTTLLMNSYNDVTFHGSFWTGGRDAQAASQFVWDNTKNMLDKSFNKFTHLEPIRTCVFWHEISITDGHLGSGPCTNGDGVLCEIRSE